MIDIIKLAIAAMVPIAASTVFYKMNKLECFSKLNYWVKQIIIGVSFGLIAILGTEWGIKVNGIIVNSRDAAPLAAGLLFGSPAGIIAGIIGGVERWYAVYWGAGYFTRVACSISTVLAGFFAAFLRTFMFERKRPTWTMSLAAGVVMEIFHLTMVMVTNVKDATKAVMVTDTCLVPMVVANGLSVMLATILISYMAGDFRTLKGLLNIDKKRSDRPIFETIQRWLFFVLIVTFASAMFFQYILETNMSKNSANRLIRGCMEEIDADISDTSDEYMLQLTNQVRREIGFGYNYNLASLCERYNFTEISIIDENGIIIESSNADNIGFDMSSGEQSSEFMCLLDDETEYVQDYGPISRDAKVYRKYAGMAFSDHKGFVQTGYNTNSFQNIVSRQVKTIANNQKVGNTGGVIILDNKFDIVSASNGINIRQLKKRDLSFLKDAINDGEVRLKDIEGNRMYVASTYTEGYYVVVFYPYEEAVLAQKVSLYVSLFSMLLIFSTMFFAIYMLIKHIVVRQIVKMTQSLSIISAGNLNEVVNVRSNKEFSSLSDDINTTVNTLKRYIAEAAARIDKELEFAKSIQNSALPEPVSMDERYDIYATMHTAKEVGGDFYDFYKTNDNVVNFLVADVSGKGIPAAMFMMRAKSVLKSLTERGLSVDDVFTSGNEALCQENDAGMFVTAWQGSLDLLDGQVYFANAGHNLPAIKKKGGKFELIKQKVNLVLGGMEGIPYNLGDMKLEPGDIVYLYTDGVTEATNAENELFGEERMLEALNAKEYDSLKELCEAVKKAIDGFVKEADQFDDITMVALWYKGE